MNTNGEQLILSSLIKNNDIVFDVGANVGDWSLRVFSSAPEAFIYAFEPIPQAYSVLEKNLKIHPARVFNKAISNKKGEKAIAYYNRSQQWAELSSFYRRQEVEKQCDLIPVLLTVPTSDLDSFCMEKNIDAIDFLKIDTEGSELDILKGAQRLLSNKRVAYVQFEYGGTYIDAQTTLKEAFDILTGHGYTVYRIMPTGLIRIKEWRNALESYRYANYLATAKPL
jgi:FkbM family methyltransferase